VSLLDQISHAAATGVALRVHTVDGEVAVVRVLDCDDRELWYRVVSSSRPERYGVCDATAFSLPLHAIERVVPVREPRRPF